jgi:hypothetical protein
MGMKMKFSTIYNWKIYCLDCPRSFEKTYHSSKWKIIKMLYRLMRSITSLFPYTLRLEKKKPEDEPIDFFLSIFIVGPRNSGKSSLMKKIIRDTFASEYEPTRRIEEYKTVLPLLVEEKYLERNPRLQMHVTELSGDCEEVFFKNVIRRASVVIFTYDCQDECGLEKTMKYLEWWQDTDQNRYKIMILMITKADEGIHPKIDTDRLPKNTNLTRWLLFKTSAKTDPMSSLRVKFSNIGSMAIEAGETQDQGDFFSLENVHVST